MAAVENDDLSGLSERSLRSRIKQAGKAFRTLEKRPRTQEVIEEMQKQADLVTAAERELRIRQGGRSVEQLQRARRDEVESRASERAERAAARKKALGMTGRPTGSSMNDSYLVWLGFAALLAVLIVMAALFFHEFFSTRTPAAAAVAGAIR